MTPPSQFMTVAPWKAALGLLPVPLRDTDENQRQYVLMNGSSGNFCLDFVGASESVSRRATAWSCDVGHYVTCTGDAILVNSWKTDVPEEKYRYRTVIEQIHKFHRHLESAEPDRSRSIIAHVLQVFHRVRAVESNGLRSLRILLHLMASATAREDRLIDSELDKWGLTQDVIEASQSITEGTWRPLYNDLVGVGLYDVLCPDFYLLFRHASGTLFQDAHLYASDSPNLWLPGFEVPVRVSPHAVPSETGIYFTPPALARTLAEECTAWIPTIAHASLSIFDPACGSGELLKECLRLLKLKGYAGRVRITGWDKSSAAVDMARFVLSLEKRSWPAERLAVDISEHDSLSEEWPLTDILVMNPPFKSWQRMEAGEQAFVSAILGSSVRPNLAMAFAHKAISAVRAEGTLAMIAPNSLLDGDAGRETRQAMAEAFHAQLIARLGEQNIFSRALVDAGLYVGRRKPTCLTIDPAVLWTDSRPKSLNYALRGLRQWRGSEEQPLSGEGFSVYHRQDIALTGVAWKARGYAAWSLFKDLSAVPNMVTVGDVFHIDQGIRLGNDVFIVTRRYWESLASSQARFFRPVVMNPSVTDGKLIDSYYAWYPYTPGLPTIANEDDLKRRVPNYYKDYLKPAESALKARKTLASQPGSNWWDLLRARNLQMEPGPKIVSKYFGGKRSFAFDKSGNFVVAVGFAWILKKGNPPADIDHVDDDRPFSPSDEERYLAILAFLTSSIAYELLEYVSVQVSGGQLDLSKKYVSSMPMINLDTIPVSNLNDLVWIGTRITDGRIVRWTEVDDLIRQAIFG